EMDTYLSKRLAKRCGEVVPTLGGGDVKGFIKLFAVVGVAVSVVFGLVSIASGSNGGGANEPCPPGQYCGSPDGPSGNGNDNQGKHTGEPCAGCVGNADDKNPPGQLPNTLAGADPNAGYECDRNKGIAQTNPAHTSCTSTPPASPPPP